jgi:excisionase family DNA binding protein
MSTLPFDNLETARDVAKRLGVSLRTIMRWTKQPDGLPFVRIGQRPYLHGPTVQDWIARRMVQPNPSRRRR